MIDEGTSQTSRPSGQDPDGSVESPVSRRGFLSKASSATVGAGLVAACGAGTDDAGAPAVQARPRVMWRMASSFPRSLDTIFGTAERMAELLSELTDGRFQIRPYPAGELVPGLQVMDAAQQGSVQVAQSASYYFTGKNAALAFDAGVPFGMTARQHNAWLAEGGGKELIAEVFSDFGIIPFQGGNTGGQMGGWFRREVPSLADLNGIKMRIPGLGGEVMNRLGLTVQVLAGGEIYPALERGAIDATEWVGPYDDEKLGFHQAAEFYYYPGWWEPCASMSYQVNRRAWDQLPSDYQAAFRAAAAYSTEAMLTTYDAKNPPALQRLLDQGVQMRRFSDDIMRAARDAIDDIQAEKAAGDGQYRRVYEHYSAFRDASFRWFGTNEFAYADFAFGNRGTAG
jgi:TRAP-type mannitol/chloroaromatic compound transport system substrate-binding protein